MIPKKKREAISPPLLWTSAVQAIEGLSVKMSASGLKCPHQASNVRHTRDDRPDYHPRAHVEARPYPRDQHVAGDLEQHIADKQDRHGDVKVETAHAQILFEIVQPRLGDGIAVDVVEEVHDAERGLSFEGRKVS